MKNVYSIAKKSAILFFFTICLTMLFANNTNAQTLNDFRSAVTTGNWNALSSWERYDGTNWVAATALPGATANNGNVTIRDGHTITLTAAPTAAISSLIVGEGNSGVMNIGAFTITITGITTIAANGTLNVTSATGTKTFTGDLTNNGTWNNSSANSPITLTGNIINNGTFTSGTGLYTLNAGASRNISGSISFGGPVSLTVAGGAYTNNGNLTVSGTLTITTATNSFTNANGATFSGATVTQTNGAFTNNGTATINTALTITAGTVTNNATFTVNGATFTGTTFVNAANATLNWGSTGTGPTTLTATATGNTVIYNNTSAAQTIKGTTYVNLTIDKVSQSGTLSVATTVSGILNIASGTLITSTLGLTVTGNTNISGTFSINGATATKALGIVTINSGGAINSTAGATITVTSLTINTGGAWSTATTLASVTINGDLTINGTFTNSISSTYSIAGNITINTGATFSSGAGAYTLTGATKTIGGTIASATFSGAMAMTGTYTNNIATLTITGILSGAGTLTMGANTTLTLAATTTTITGLNCTTNTPNTVVYSTAGSTMKNSATTYYNLSITAAGTVSQAVAGNTILNNLVIGNGSTLADATFLITGNASGTLTLTGTGILTLTNITSNPFPTFATYSLPPNSTVNFNANAAQNIPVLTYGNLTLATGGVKTVQGAITVGGNLTISAGTLADGGFIITENGNVTNNGIHSGSGKLLLSGGVTTHALTGTAGTYGNIELNDSQGATVANTSGTTTVSGNLTITSGNITLNSFTTGLSVTGATSIAGGSSLTFGSATGTRTFTGDVTVSGSWLNTINVAVTMAGNLTVNSGATFTSGTAVNTFSGTTKTISGSAASISIPSTTFTGTLTNNIPIFNCSTALAGTGTLFTGANTTLNIGGTSTITTLNCTTNTPNTVVYYGGTQTVKATIYYHLQIGTLSPSTTPIATAGGVITINGNFAVNAGLFSDGGNIMTGNGTGTFSVGAGAAYTTVRIVTPWMPTLYTIISLDPASTFNYNGTTAHNIVASPNGTIAVTSYGNLGIGGAVVKTLATAVSLQGINIAASTTLADGTFQISGPGTGSGTFTMASGANFTMTNTNTGNTSNYLGCMPLFATYALNAVSITIYNAVASQTIYNIPAPGYGHLRLQAGSANTKSLLTGGTTTYVQGTLTTNASNTLDFAGQTLSIAGATPLSNAGILTANAASSTLLLNGSVAQTFTLGGTYTGSIIDNLNTANAAGVTLGSNVNVNNVSINSGTFSTGASYTLGISGSYTNNGNLTANGASAVLEFKGTSAQNFSVGTYTSSVITNFKINNAAVVTLNSPVNATTLTLTNGNLNTTPSNLLTVTGTAVANVTGGSATSYVNGPLARTFTTTSTGTNTFPIGKGNYNLFEMLNPAISAGNVTITVEVFDAAAGGNDGTGFSSAPNPDRYWKVVQTNTGTMTSAGTIRLLDAGMTLTSSNTIGNSTTQGGSYSNLGGSQVNSPLSGNISTTVTVPLTLGYFKIGSKGCISGTYTVGAGGNYTKISQAVAALNNALVCSDVYYELQADYDGSLGESLPITINALSYSGGPWHVTFRPADGVSTAKVTSGDAGSGNAVINLNGANNIIFDGVPGGSTSGNAIADGKWIIRNTRTAATIGPALQFINDASNNTMKYLQIEGQNATSASGLIVFSSTTGTTGNDNDSITYCTIRDRSDISGTPTNAIYASGTFGKSNNGIVISNNNIYNFWNPSGASNGILISNYNTDWTISGNSFYQTPTRAGASTAYMHTGIQINNSTDGNNFNISNNFIGGGAPGATGTAWTISNAGSAQPAFNGIYMNILNNGTSLVQYNTVANMSISSINISGFPSNVFTGILSASNGAVTIDHNTIGSGTGSGSIAISNATNTGALVVGIGQNTSSGAVNITNNTVGSFTISSSSSYSVSFNGIRYGQGGSSSSRTISGNLIGSRTTSKSINDNTGSNSSTAQVVIGIIMTGGANAVSVTNNTIANLYNNRPSTGLGQVIGIYSPYAPNTITGNSIHDLSTNCNNEYFGTTSAIIGIALTASSANGHTVSNNTIHSLYNTSSSNAVNLIGIYYYPSTGGTNVIDRNFIHSIYTNSTSTTARLSGIYIKAGSANVTNNMVRLGIKSDGSSLSNPNVYFGICDSLSTTNNFYHNSVYIGGSAVTGAINTYALYSYVATGVRAIQDNIFWNARTNGTGTGKHYAIRIGATTSLTCDYNDLYANGTGGVIGANGAVDYTNIALWRTGTGLDAHSINNDPQFINSIGDTSTVNLHINPNVSTPIEGVGFSISSVSTDFDNEIRSSLTPTDIGADAGDFLPIDLTPPVITYTSLSNTCNGTNSYILGGVSITDASGIDVATGTAPRLYYKKATDATTTLNTTPGTAGWKYVESGSVISPFTFTIDFTTLSGGGVSAGDIVQYFIIAQDASSQNNIGINPSGVTLPSAVSVDLSGITIGGTPNSFTLLPCSGTVTVGTGGNYPSLTNAGGLFEAINATTLTGNLTASIISDLTNEIGAIALNQWAESAPGNYTLTIQPDAATLRTVSGTTVATGAPMIPINGADRFTIDGHYGASGQYLLIRNTNATAANTGAVIQFNNSSTNCTFTNCIVESNATGVNGELVFGSSGTNANISITNNDFRDASSGTIGNPATILYSSSTSNNNITVSDNNFYNWTSNGIAFLSIGNGNTISGNSFYCTANINSGQTSINLSSVSSNGSLISGNYIGGTAPNCGGSAWVNSGTGAMTGIYLNTGTTTATSVQGNIIRNISMTSPSAGYPFIGILVSAGLVNVGTITENIIGDPTTVNSIQCASPAGLYGIKSTSGSSLTIRNNVISNLRMTNNAVLGPQIIGIAASAGTNTISGNSISKLYSDAITLASGTTASNIGILQTSTIGGQTISGNTITALTNTSSSQANVMLGICYSGATSGTNIIEKNFIHSFNEPSATGIVSGIYVAGGASDYRNNIIRLGIDSDGNSIIPAVRFTGISKATTANNNFYFNSIYIGGTGVNTATTNNTYAFRRESSGTDIILNNIFVNTRSNDVGSTNKHYAIVYNNKTGVTSNYNILYSPGTGGIIASLDGGSTTCTTLNAYQVASGLPYLDLSSISADPNYNNPTAATPDLHISGNTPAEGTGFNISSITSDFDGDVRASNTPTDIGADATNGTANDIVAPAITYTSLGSQYPCGAGTTINLTATIIDAISGVPTMGGNVPRIYYRRSSPTATSWFSSAGTLATGNGNYGTWNFTFSYASLGVSPSIGDVYQYYVVAQDQAANPTYPNMGSSVFDATTPVFTNNDVNYPVTHPTSPSSFSITAFGNTPLSGNVYVGGTNPGNGSPWYSTLTKSDGFFRGVYDKGLSGNVTVLIRDNITTEDGNFSLYSWSEYCGTGYTIKIQPETASLKTISGSLAAMGLFSFSNADRVTIDGRYNGSGRYLKFENTYSSTGGSENDCFRFENCNNDTVKYCEIVGQTTKASAGGVVYFSSGNSDFVLENNKIHGGTAWATNIILGYSGSTINHDITIKDNEIFDFLYWSGGTATRSNGIYIRDGYNWTITGNSIYNTGINGQNVQTAINFVPGATSNGNIISNNWIGGSSAQCGTGGSVTYWGNSYTVQCTEVTLKGIDINAGSVLVDGNNISNIYMQGCDYGGFVGIHIQGSSMATITNNVLGTGSNGQPDGSKSIKVAQGGCMSCTNGVGYIYGIWNQSSSSSTTTYDHNDFYYLWQSGAYWGGSVQCITHQAAGPASVTNNRINGPQATGLGVVNSFGIRLEPTTSTSGNLIENNRVAGPYLTVTDATGYGSGNFGIYVKILSNYTVSGVISKNVIWDMRNADYGGAGVTEGIYVYTPNTATGNGNWNIYNNQVTLKNNGSTLNSVALYGIDIALNSTSTTNINYNTVYISGSNGGAALAGYDYSSYAFFRQPLSNPGDIITLKNNIFINSRTVGNGYVTGHFAIANTNGNDANWNSSNNNFLFTNNGTLNKIGQWGATLCGTLANWQTSSGKDANSYTATVTTGASNFGTGLLNPDNLFINSLSDLHISIADAQSYQFVSNRAVASTIITDFDGQTRPLDATPDIGADEFTSSNCVAVAVNTHPSNSAAVCSNNGTATFTVTVTGDANYDYQWQVNNGGGWTNLTNAAPYGSTAVTSGSASNSNTLTVTNPTSSYNGYQYRCIITNCSGGSTATSNGATLLVNPRPTAVISGNATICNGQSATLTITVSGNGSINGTLSDGSVFSGTAPTIIVNKSPSSNITYTLASLYDGNCSAYASDLSGLASITVNPRPTGLISGSATICNGQSTTLTLSVTGSGTISGTLSNGLTFSGPAPTITVNVSPFSNITYSIASLSDANCSALAGDLSGSASIIVNSRPTSVLSGSATICSGQTYSIPISVTGTGTISGTFSDGTSFSGTAPILNAIVSPTSNTTFTVTTLNDANCAAQISDLTGSFGININPALTVYHNVYNETFGTSYTLPSGWSASPSYDWSIDGSSTSTGYIGASGGSNATALNGAGVDASIISSSIDFSSLTNARLTFGLRKTGTFSRNLAIEVSTDNFATIAFSKIILNSDFPTATYWGLMTVNLGNYIDNASAVKIRFRLPAPSGGTGNIRIDDITLSSAMPTIIPVGPITLCSGGSTALTSSAGSTYLWSPYNETTQSITVTASGNYSVQVNGCAVSLATVVNISTPPSPPTIGTITQPTCTQSSGSVILNNLPGTGNWTINPGNIIGSGVTTTITGLASGTYNFSVTNSSGCTSGSSGSITINTQPQTPVAPSGSTTQSFCPPATIGNLASSGTGIQWYDVATGGSPLSSGITLQNNSHYYASQTTSGCESTNRLDVTVTINSTSVEATSISGNLSICSGESTNLTINSGLLGTGASWVWYTGGCGTGTSIGTGNSLLVTPAASTSYFARAEGLCNTTICVNTNVTINPASVGGTIYGSTTICPGATSGLLILSGNSGSVIKWQSSVYPFSTWNDIANTGTTYTSGNLTETTQFRAVIQNGICSVAYSIPAIVTVNIPAAPTGNSSQTLCNNSTVASLQASGTSIQWYNSANGGSPLSSGTVLLNGTHYFGSQTINGCESIQRLEVTVTLTSPNAPTGNSPQSFCNSATVNNLQATGTNIKWYAASSGGSALSSGIALVNGNHYYASQTDIDGCESTSRLNVSVIVNSPNAPTGNPNQFFCAGNSPTVANLAANGSGIKWYDDGGNLLSSGTALTDETLYYASQTVNGCESISRLEVTVTVFSVPTLTLGTNPSVCKGATSATLSFTGTSGDPQKYSIDYDATANTAGFVDINNAGFTDPLALTLPGTAAAGTYNGTISVKNGPGGSGCSSISYNFSVTINAAPAITITSTTIYVISGNTNGNLPYTSSSGSPTLYSIDFDAAANTAGFVDLADNTLPSSPILINLPTGVANATYNAVLRVKNNLGCTSIAYPFSIIVSSGLQWTGTVSTNWSVAGNWSSNSVPTSLDNVEILSGVTNMPHITTSLTTPTVCNNLTIGNGAIVTIDAGKALTVNGNLIVNGEEALIVKASSTENGSLITLGNITYQNSGSVKVEKYVSSGIVSHWEYLSSPVDAASSSIFTCTVPTARGLWWVNETQNAWVSIPHTAPANMTVLKGYARNYVTSEGGGNVIKNITGALNTGTQSISLTRTETAPGGKHGWNLVGNPYPNAVDWNATGWTKTNLCDAIYYRYDGTIRAYVDGLGTGATPASGIIPAMTSFWVRVDSLNTTGTLACNNSVRVHSLTPPTITPVNTLHLTVVNNTNQIPDDTYIRFKGTASDGFDKQYDAYKMYASDATIPQIYTRIPGADDICINTMGTLSGYKMVPLGFKTTVAGTFTITADMVASLTANGNYVYLKDNATTVVQNLAINNSYQFTSGITNGFGRFELLFNPPVTVFPTITLISNSLTVAANAPSVNLAFSGTTNSPNQYSIDFDATANTAGFIDVANATLPASPIVISIPSGVSPGLYKANLSVRISGSGAVSINYPITIEVQTVFTTSQDIGTTLRLSWSPTSGASGYTIQYRLPAGVWIGNPVGTNNQVKFNNLTEGTQYECRVITYKNGTSSVSNIGNFATQTLEYSQDKDIGTTLEVVWPSLTWASFYKLEYRTVGATTWTALSSSTNRIKISNLTPETDYECKVSVYANGLLWGTIQTGIITSGKVDFVTSNVTTTSLTLSWTDFTPWATSYTLQYRLPAGTWISKPVNTATSVALTNLAPATSYECKLYVYKTTQWGISQVGTFQTAGTKEASIDNLNNSNSISIYPNPFTEQMNMDIFTEEQTNVNWKLYDMTGKLVLSGNENISSGYSTLKIDAAQLPKGVYMINAILNEQMKSFRIMKQ